MKALAAALEPEFGSMKIFRPYRDVRFAKDKTPYKTHQGAFVGVAPATGWYVEVSPRGVRTGAGFYDADGPRLAAFRHAIVDDTSGPRLSGSWPRSRRPASTSPANSSRPRPGATTRSTRASPCSGTSSSSPAG